MERKRERIKELRQKTKDVQHSVTAQHEHMELLIEAINEMHDSILELTDVMKPEPIPEKKPAKAETLEEKPPLDLRGIFRRKPKK